VSDSYHTLFLLFLSFEFSFLLKTRILSYILMNNKVKMAVICGNVSKFAPKFVIEYSMRRIFRVFCEFLVVTLTLTSCLSSSDSETTTYNDMAIKTFTLGTLNRYLHTKSSTGADSIYKTTYAATDYKMSIDQIGHRIFNVDSLLKGTDLSRVICNVATVNNGIVYVKSLTSDTLVYFMTGTDSIDFTQPRQFRVFASDGSGSRDYTVSLNVRQFDAGVFNWIQASQTDFPYVKPVDIDWTKEQIDSTDIAMLPQRVLAVTSWTTGPRTTYTLLAGYNEASPESLVLWRKLTDRDGSGRWVYMPVSEQNHYFMPMLDALSLVYYNKVVLAFCSNKKIYVSRDQGITWKTTSTYAFPAGFNSDSFEAATDDEGYVWLTDRVSGQTWKGKLTE